MKKHNKTNKTESAIKQVVNTRGNTEKREVKRDLQNLVEKVKRAACELGSKSQPEVAGVNGDKLYVGIDLGDKKSNYCFLDREGKFIAEGIVATT